MNERLTVRFPPSLAHQLAAVATRRGVAVSDILREALQAYFDAPPQDAPQLVSAPPSVPAPLPVRTTPLPAAAWRVCWSATGIMSYNPCKSGEDERPVSGRVRVMCAR
jgi:hypothetical protein